MPFQVQQDTPYEGTAISEFDTLEQALDYVARRKLFLDEVTLIEMQELDVYSLMAARRKAASTATKVSRS